MIRRTFLKKTALAGLSGFVLPRLGYASPVCNQEEILYNGIYLPEIWPPRNKEAAYMPMPVPYLNQPPEVIPIDVGRQLFVDNFLIQETGLERKMHQARKLDINPIFKPETELEQGQDNGSAVTPSDGGVWWDPKDKLFKMWYMAGRRYSMAYATSKDGIHWDRPQLDFDPGTNRILPGLAPDSTTVWLDHFTANPNERFKMFLRQNNDVLAGPNHYNTGWCMVSPDGIHWNEPVATGYCGDRSTIFYNPFRKKWIYSLRSRSEWTRSYGRSRFYHEHSDFLKGCKWTEDEPVFWTGADNLDIPDPEIGDKAELYNLSAVGYESIILGLHTITVGPANQINKENGIPRINDLKVSYSRDGFHLDRPDREAFIRAERKPGYWDRGYLHSVGGICTIVGDQLRFYYSGIPGNPDKLNGKGEKIGHGSDGCTGIAVLRRDGFASMSAGGKTGTLTTRPVTFKGEYLFVNVNCPDGQLKVEILDGDYSPIAPFSLENCHPVSIDSTIQQVKWKKAENLSSLKNKKVRFRFHLTKGDLYAFWVSPDKSGASMGFNAAGGPGFTGGIDTEGKNAYREANKILNNKRFI